MINHDKPMNHIDFGDVRLYWFDLDDLALWLWTNLGAYLQYDHPPQSLPEMCEMDGGG